MEAKFELTAKELEIALYAIEFTLKTNKKYLPGLFGVNEVFDLKDKIEQWLYEIQE